MCVDYKSTDYKSTLSVLHSSLEILRTLRIEEMSPLDAMTKLYELQRIARQ